MKKLWFVLLSLGLIAVFSTSATAVDLKISGEYYAAGMYLDKTTFKKGTATDGPSTAFFYQGLRLNTDLIIAPGLTLEVMSDIMKRAWGANRSDPTSGNATVAGDDMNNYTAAEGENIGLQQMLLKWTMPFGRLTVGYDGGSTFGTKFGNNGEEIGDGIIKVDLLAFKPWIFSLKYYKTIESSPGRWAPTSTYSDADADKYLFGFGRPWKGGGFGFYANYSRNASYRKSLTNPFRSEVYTFCAYARHNFGKIYVETEGKYQTGKTRDYEQPSLREDIKRSTLAYYANLQANLGMFYTGGIFAYSSGDDPSTTRGEGDSGTGTDWNPNLILWNYERSYWQGAIAGHGTTTNDGPMRNALYGQIYAGVKPIDKLNIKASVAYAHTDHKPNDTEGDYGWEVDLQANYQITNNLSYMIGAGYLFTGDYFKGAKVGGVNFNQISDDYMVVSKLTLTF